MARLAESERRQLRAAPVQRPQTQVRCPIRPAADYVAFATFAARFIPPREFKPITKGSNWKL